MVVVCVLAQAGDDVIKSVVDKVKEILAGQNAKNVTVIEWGVVVR